MTFIYDLHSRFKDSTMRPLLLLLFTSFVLICCSEKEKQTIKQELLLLSDSPQSFTISNDKRYILDVKHGAKITIDANSLEFMDGTTPSNPIQIIVKEVYHKSEMILNGISTTSDGRLLESLGMLYIKATSENKELKVKDGKSITVSIPNKKGAFEGELFYGEEKDSVLNWRYAGTTKDTTKIIETILPMSNDRTRIQRATYRFKNGLRELVSDTTFTTWLFEAAIGVDSTMGEPQKEYLFPITKLGWINCDRFIEIKEKIDLSIELKKFAQPYGYLVFKSINSVMPVYFDEKGKGVVRYLPKDYNIEVVVLDKIKGDIMWAKKTLQTQSNQSVVVETRKVNKEELTVLVKELSN